MNWHFRDPHFYIKKQYFRYQQIIEGCANEKNVLFFHDDDESEENNDDNANGNENGDDDENESDDDFNKFITPIMLNNSSTPNTPEVCKNIWKVDLKPDDLLSSDIPTKIELTYDKRSFIEDFMLYEDARFPKVISRTIIFYESGVSNNF
ncbi:hypothetical protein F8M41_023152 [Gigaspora margarita]|uniref:Uncharacterized protein n=1 Tax=Gigaspora margarita TaxID=4874 RepID=A0A8H4ADV0_GIGMA|nr:hypothetical protein F8M41_023152 [Gigaspora margarita]